MLLILDYDETYTRSPEFWDSVIQRARLDNHTVICCTMRVKGQDAYNQDVITHMGKHGIPIIYAATYRDKWEAVEKAGYVPENGIWIDDRPMFIFMNRKTEELPN